MVSNVATPFSTSAVPRVLASSINVTVPVGLFPVTVADSFAVSPKFDGFGEEVRVIPVAFFTICDKGAEVLGRVL
uniref:Uncharacterized protein n=1 Tax=Streptomyces sp. NBC_00180 TaxID=2903632 RepID=A0AAU1IFL8_9ACTN